MAETELEQTTPAHASRGHHPYSPSTLQAREASPCYKPNSGGTNKAAERGTAQHEAVDTGVVADDLTDEEAQAVLLAMDVLTEAERALGPDCVTLREQYLPVDNDGHLVDGEHWPGTTAGYSDICAYSLANRVGHVIDWKFGKYAVEPAQNNTQGIAYALGLWKHVFDTHGVILDRVQVTFVSPHIEDRSEHSFDRAQRDELLLRVRKIVHQSKHADELLGRAQHPSKEQWQQATEAGMVVPTTSACLFCARIATCPAVAARALSVSKKYSPVEFPEGLDIRGFDLTDPALASRALAVGKVAERWASEFRKRVTDLAFRDEDFIPDGYNLIATWPRKVVDKRGLFDKVVALFGASFAWSIVDLPLTPVEDKVSEQAPRGQKTAAVEQFSEELATAGLVTKSAVPTVSLRMKSGKAGKQ